MLSTEEVKQISEQKTDSEQLIVTWTNAIRADVEKEPLKVRYDIGNNKNTIEAKLNNEDGMQHTLAFLRKYPDFNVNVSMYQCNVDALQSTLNRGSLELTQLLFEHNANPHSTPSFISPIYQINMQLNAFAYDSGESASCLLGGFFKSEMELGRARLELMLCYGYRPPVQDIKKLYEHYTTIAPEDDIYLMQNKRNTNVSSNNVIENGITKSIFSYVENIRLIGTGFKFLQKGIEKYQQRKKKISLPEPIYDQRQFITPLELSSRLYAAIKDIDERENNIARQVTLAISESMGNTPMPLANLVYQYSDIALKVRGQIYEQRKAEGATIAFRYKMR